MRVKLLPLRYRRQLSKQDEGPISQCFQASRAFVVAVTVGFEPTDTRLRAARTERHTLLAPLTHRAESELDVVRGGSS